MKSIFSLRFPKSMQTLFGGVPTTASDEIKSASYLPASAGFHRVAISSTAGGFLPQKADLVEKKSKSYDLLFFSGGDDRI